MNFSRSLSRSLFRASRALGISLLILYPWNWLLPAPPAPPVGASRVNREVPNSANEKAAEPEISKRERKTQKRERQQQDMLRRVEQKGKDGTPLRRPAAPEVPVSSPKPAELTE